MNMVHSSLTAEDTEKQSAKPLANPYNPPAQQTPDSMDEFLDRLEARSMALVMSDQTHQAQKARVRSTQVLMLSVLVALWISTLVLAVAYIRVNNHPQPLVQRLAFHTHPAIEAPKPAGMDYVVVPTPPAHAQAAKVKTPAFPSDGIASYFRSQPQNSEQLTAMHSTLNAGTRVRVTNVANGRSVVVKITAHSSSHKNRIINVSAAAAEELGFMKAGSARVHLELITN